MPLSKEEQETLDRLAAKAKEPDRPAGNVNFNLDLSNDSAWQRAQKLGLVPGDEPPPGSEGGEGGEGGDPPRRRGGGEGFFGGQ